MVDLNINHWFVFRNKESLSYVKFVMEQCLKSLTLFGYMYFHGKCLPCLTLHAQISLGTAVR